MKTRGTYADPTCLEIVDNISIDIQEDDKGKIMYIHDLKHDVSLQIEVTEEMLKTLNGE